jgi:hypothetical protein
MKILPAGTELFHADVWREGQTDMTKITVAFRYFAYSFKNIQLFEATQNNPLNLPYTANKLISMSV